MKTTEKKENDFSEHIYSEKALLSSIISLQEINEAKDEIMPADFYDLKCREIYIAMLEQYKNNPVIEITDLSILMGEEYTDFLSDLMSINAYDFRLYLKKVKENSAKRKKTFYIEEYKNNEITTNELIKALQNIESEIIEEVKFKPSINLPMLALSERNIVFGFNIEYGSMCITAGATGTGKTELTMEIADIHAKNPNSLSLLCYFEGNEKHIQERLRQKGINNENLLYAIKPSFKDIKKILQKNKDKKVFLVIDYLQKLARHMRVRDKRPTEMLMIYIDKIFEYFDDLRNEFSNVCICFLASYSKAGITEMKAERLPDMLTIANGIKESGDIAYDVDYGYALFFADEDERLNNKWSVGRKIKGKYRKYVLLYGFKDSRINGDIKENIYIFNPESKLYDLRSSNEFNETQKKETNKKGRPRGKRTKKDDNFQYKDDDFDNIGDD